MNTEITIINFICLLDLQTQSQHQTIEYDEADKNTRKKPNINS